MAKRTLIISDVHGCIDELNQLLRLLSYSQHDRLIFVADLIDRGPDSAACLRKAMELKAESVLGNHEEKMIRYRNWERKVANGEAKKNPMHFSERKLKDYHSFTDAQFDWMAKLPLILRIDEKHIVVHGGLEPNKPLNKQPKHVTMIRYVKEHAGYFVGSRDPSKQPPGTVYWSTVWPGPESVFYGHEVHSLESPRIDQFDGYACYGLDSGCVYGGRLTAAILTDSGVEFAQVKAKKVYFDRNDYKG